MILKDYYQENRIHFRHYFLLLIICLLAYWPLTFGVFSVKNDAIHYFLPYRFHISEALRNGEGPFWSPYIYMGYPVQGDMQSGAWNPFVWLFSLFGRNNLTIFHFENLLYIFLGGVGMYKLTNRFCDHGKTALLTGVAYMLSGFMLSGQLINWLASAAFIPFVIHYFLLLLQTGRLNAAVKGGISLYLLLTAGYPSFFIMTGYLLLILFAVSLWDRYRRAGSGELALRRQLTAIGVFVLVFAGLSLPAIVSYLDLLPYYGRGQGVSYEETTINSFDIKHLVTLFYPATIKANNMASVSDITCRNVYIGIIPLLLLIAMPPKGNRRNILLTLLAVFALLFSLGDVTPLRKWCYQLIPLMNTFRHPSQARLFFLFALLLLAAPGLKKLLTGTWSETERRTIKTVFLAAGAICLITLLITVPGAALFKASGGNGGLNDRLKALLDSVTFEDTAAVNSTLQLGFLAVVIFWFQKWSRSWLVFASIWIANLFIMAQLVLPASFVSKMAPASMNQVIQGSPHGFPANLLSSPVAGSNDSLSSLTTNSQSMYDFYSKRILTSRITNSPAFLNEVDSFVQTHHLYNYVSSQPAVYIADRVAPLSDTTSPALDSSNSCRYAFSNSYVPERGLTADCGSGTARIRKLSSNSFEIEVKNNQQSELILTQAFHHSWKAYADGKPATIHKMNMAFMGISVPEGEHIVSFRFVPANTIGALWVQALTVIILLLSLTFYTIKRKRTP